MKKLVVLQPGYLPWLGFFDQYAWADEFVLYDDVQFDKNGWRNRNRIRTAQGWQWLTVPVLTKGQDLPANREVRINPAVDWRRKHRLGLQQSYSRSPHFDRVYPPLEAVLEQEWEHLVDLDVAMLRVLVGLLGMEWKVHLSSELEAPGRRTDRLVGICRSLAATDYLTGDAARSYLDESAFEAAGVRVHWHGYEHPTYPQVHPGEFISHLSVVDLLFNHGPDSLEILTGARRAGCLTN